MLICKIQLGILLFLIVGIMIEIVYIRYLFREEAQNVVYFRQLVPDEYIVSTTPLVFNKEDFSSYEDDAKLLDSELRDVVYYKPHN